MVIMKNNFSIDADVDSVVMNAAEEALNESKASQAGHPKAILICRRNSHPFQARTLILNTPAKIGRSVARARPSSNNGIFDCKVLSRNHAIIWYEYDTGKFMIQDTKSSNGTFVNNQRLSKGGETSLPREFFSRDVVQFGVDVLENQRKGNDDSENCDESNHIVTHGCIVAIVRLFHPNGKESKSGHPYSPPNPMSIPQEKICKLELIIHEAQQREERLHDKLEELQFIINNLEFACQEALTNRFEETRLLSKIESLEKQTKVMSKIMSGGSGKSEKVEAEIQQLLADIEKVQSVAREIQERQHRKLLESEQKLVEAQRVASNLGLEVIALREQASLTESQLQYMGTKCTAYCQKIETFKSNFYAQLEAQVAKFVEREVERELNDTNLSDLNFRDKYKFILDESEKDVPKKDKDSQDVILEWCKTYEEIDKIEEKDLSNEDDKADWLTKKLETLGDAMCSGLEHISNCIGQLVSSLLDVEKSRKNLEKLCIKKHELAFQLDSAKMPILENEKTEDELDGEKNEVGRNTLILIPLSNEKITELENELKEQEEERRTLQYREKSLAGLALGGFLRKLNLRLERNAQLLSQERVNHRELEARCTKLRCELDAVIKHCKKLNSECFNLKTLLRSHFKCLEDATQEYKQKIIKLESEMQELVIGQELKLVDIPRGKNKNVDVAMKETQTSFTALISSSTNTEYAEVEPETTKQEMEKVTQETCRFLGESSEDGEPFSVPAVSLSDPSGSDLSTLDKSLPVDSTGESTIFKVVESEVKFSCEKGLEAELMAENLGIWEKMRKIERLLSDQPSKESPLSDVEFVEMKSLMNLVAEDLVHLLLREQQMRQDKLSLQKKLEKSMSTSDVSNFGLIIHSKTLMLFLVTATIAYFLYSAIS